MKRAAKIESPASEKPLNPVEWMGKGYGFLLGSVTGIVSVLRGARTFHPRGRICTGTAVRMPRSGGASPRLVGEIAERLEGNVLVRLSTALWKNEREWPDVLGCAIRFRKSEVRWEEHAIEGDQDLLFATVRHPSVLMFAPLFTQPHDFFANTYYAVSPFSLGQAPGAGKELFFFKIEPEAESMEQGTEKTRVERLAARVRGKKAVFILSVQLKAERSGVWYPCLRIEFINAVSLDDRKLKFIPFRDGAGVHPRGLIQYLRIGAYRMSQAGRPRA